MARGAPACASASGRSGFSGCEVRGLDTVFSRPNGWEIRGSVVTPQVSSLGGSSRRAAAGVGKNDACSGCLRCGKVPCPPLLLSGSHGGLLACLSAHPPPRVRVGAVTHPRPWPHCCTRHSVLRSHDFGRGGGAPARLSCLGPEWRCVTVRPSKHRARLSAGGKNRALLRRREAGLRLAAHVPVVAEDRS